MNAQDCKGDSNYPFPLNATPDPNINATSDPNNNYKNYSQQLDQNNCYVKNEDWNLKKKNSENSKASTQQSGEKNLIKNEKKYILQNSDNQNNSSSNNDNYCINNLNNNMNDVYLLKQGLNGPYTNNIIGKNNNYNYTNNINNINGSNGFNNQNMSINNNQSNNKNNGNDNQNKKNYTCFINDGDRSYLNAILQCLVNIKLLKNFFLSVEIGKYLTNNSKNLRLPFITLRAFYHYYEKKDKYYSLQIYSKILGELNKIYDSLKSRNPNECLVFILENLSEQLNKIKPKKEPLKYNNSLRDETIKYSIINYKNSNDSIISDIFNWFHFKEFHCFECGNISFELNNFNTFQLDALGCYKAFQRNNINIFECIKFDFEKERNIYCKNCKKKEKSTIISSFYKLPKVFVFLLDIGEDINFNLEERINLSKFCESKTPAKYELIGIIFKKVKNETKYVSFVKSFEDQKWYFFDEKVELYNISQVNLDNNNLFIPCTLFYKLME